MNGKLITASEVTPEESVTIRDFMAMITEISQNGGDEVLEDIDLESLKCDNGACPI